MSVIEMTKVVRAGQSGNPPRLRSPSMERPSLQVKVSFWSRRSSAIRNSAYLLSLAADGADSELRHLHR